MFSFVWECGIWEDVRLSFSFQNAFYVFILALFSPSSGFGGADYSENWPSLISSQKTVWHFILLARMHAYTNHFIFSLPNSCLRKHKKDACTRTHAHGHVHVTHVTCRDRESTFNRFALLSIYLPLFVCFCSVKTFSLLLLLAGYLSSPSSSSFSSSSTSTSFPFAINVVTLSRNHQKGYTKSVNKHYSPISIPSPPPPTLIIRASHVPDKFLPPSLPHFFPSFFPPPPIFNASNSSTN